MDPISVRMTRASLLWLVLGFTLGALMLSDAVLPGHWRVWFSPTHGHILFVGWFLQFALGVAYWLLPRKRSAALPLGYRERPAFAAFLLLNVGLLARVIAEPLGRTSADGPLVDWSLVVSSLLQLGAVAILARQLWSRLVPRRSPRRESESVTTGE
jgi:hypothetical protein